MTSDSFLLSWRRAVPAVRRVLANHARFRTAEDREDLLQDVCVKAYQYRESIDPSRFVAWCCRTTHHLCVDEQRRDRSRVKIFPLYGEDGGVVFEEAVDEPSPLDVLIARQAHADVLGCLEKINEMQRETWLLRAQGLSYDDIGEIQGSTAGAARSRMNRVREEARLTRTLQKRRVDSPLPSGGEG